MAKENLRLKNVGTKYYLELIGSIDDEVNFTELNIPDATEITVNFEQVTRIQSCGIREWIQLINPYVEVPFVYLKCPMIIVDQMSMLDGFLPKNGRVESFYVPYWSEETGEQKSILFTFGVEFDQKGIYPPKEVLDSSGNLMDMDVVEAKYFKFLKKQKLSA